MSVFKNNLNYKICLKYSNSVCDLLIVKLLSVDLIINLVYRPPSSPLSDFDYIITKTRECILFLPTPLPNIILLGDFNMPDVIWDNPHAYNPCCCCCLPTPMALASGGGESAMFPLVVHQPASPSIWPAVQSLRRGLSTNPGATMWCVCGCS